MKTQRTLRPDKKGRIYFPQVGGKKSPWFVVKLLTTDIHSDLYDIFSSEGTSLKGWIGPDKNLYVCDILFKPLTGRLVNRVIDVASYESVLKAVKLTFLYTQESNADIRSRKIQERLLIKSQEYDNKNRNK